MKYVVLNLANFPKKPVKSYCPASEHIYICGQTCSKGVRVGSAWKCGECLTVNAHMTVSVCGCLWVGMCVGDTCRGFTHGRKV